MIDNEDNNDEFGRYFNAFLSAFRSVTWVMQAEFSRCSGFNPWYKDKINKT